MSHLTLLSIEKNFQLDIYGAYKTLIGVIFTTFSPNYDVIKISNHICTISSYVHARPLVQDRADVESDVKREKSLSPSKRLGKGTGYPKGKGCAS